MVSKISFFLSTLMYNVFRFFPQRKQEFVEYLEQLSEDVSLDLWCGDILEIWLEEFGCVGLLLGNISVFLIGFLVLIAADIVIWRVSNTCMTMVMNLLSGCYCLDKFKSSPFRSAQNILILSYILISILAGFQWTMTMIFLVLFVNMTVYAKRGVKK